MEHIRYILLGAAAFAAIFLTMWLLHEFWLARRIAGALLFVGACWFVGFVGFPKNSGRQIEP